MPDRLPGWRSLTHSTRTGSDSPTPTLAPSLTFIVTTTLVLRLPTFTFVFGPTPTVSILKAQGHFPSVSPAARLIWMDGPTGCGAFHHSLTVVFRSFNSVYGADLDILPDLPFVPLDLQRFRISKLTPPPPSPT